MRFFAQFAAAFLALTPVATAQSEDGSGEAAEHENYGPAPGERTLRFPKDHPVGAVFLADWEAGVFDLRTDDLQRLDAQGDVIIPPAKQVQLMLYTPPPENDPADLSPLDQLGPTDLQGLHTPFTRILEHEAARLKRHQSLRVLELGPLTKVTDICLLHVSNLTALEALGVPETDVSDNGLKYLEKLTNLKKLDLYGTKVTGLGLVHLRDMTQMRHLELGHTKVDDEALANLKNMTRLKFLSLWGTRVTDAGLVHLKDFTSLKHLHLGYGPRITDAGIVHLLNLKELEWLELGHTNVTEQGRARLKEALPKLTYIGAMAKRPEAAR